MIDYLLDSSALWRILRNPPLRKAWSRVIGTGAIGSCHPQRIEFRNSARDVDEYERMTIMFDRLYPEVPVLEQTSRWAEAAQHRLLRAGAHRALSPVDLLVCATAALHGLTVLHDDRDFVTAARHLADVHQRRVVDLPGGSEINGPGE